MVTKRTVMEEFLSMKEDLERSCPLICDIFKEQLNPQKVIITSRIKGIKSLEQKIKRKKLDKRYADGELLVSLLNDVVGIRIICMKIEDEDAVYQRLREVKNNFEGENISFQPCTFDYQPVTQQNEHSIYKFDAHYLVKSGERIIPIEIQIKSLANLFWGEMEHLLFYKNTKYLMFNSYYAKEIDSIYDELRIIDKKLTHMESTMMKDDEQSHILENMEVFKRYLYLNFRELFEAEQGEILNNNYIFNAIAEYLFVRRCNEIDTELSANDQFKKFLNVILNGDVSKICFKDYDEKFSDGILSGPSEVNIKLNSIIKDRTTGWWLYIVISSVLLKCAYSDPMDIPKDNTRLEDELRYCMNDLMSVISKYIILSNSYETTCDHDTLEVIKRFSEGIAIKVLMDYSKKKDLSFVNIDFAKGFRSKGHLLLDYYLDIALFNNYGSHSYDSIIQLSHNILINCTNDFVDITEDVILLAEEIMKITTIKPTELIVDVSKGIRMNLKTFFNILRGIKNGGVNYDNVI